MRESYTGRVIGLETKVDLLTTAFKEHVEEERQNRLQKDALLDEVRLHLATLTARNVSNGGLYLSWRGVLTVAIAVGGFVYGFIQQL